MIIGNKEFNVLSKKYIMGILNVTPDSFSDGGKFIEEKAALIHVEQMIAEGADIIDVGGESTRPGYTQISDEEEIQRTVPIIRAIKKNFDIPVSIDTYKSEVAKACADAGVDLINDIWGFQYDEKIAKVTAEYKLACCLMHNRKMAEYSDFCVDVSKDLERSIAIAVEAGVDKDKIILDPGVGFAKSYEENLKAIKYVNELQKLGYPILLGTSRKSVIGLTLNVPATERMIGTVTTTIYGAMNGCAFFRVHDVKENRQALDMLGAIEQI